MAISKVSFFKTPQANDDEYYWTEDQLQLNSKIYNTTTGYLTLDVMANDLGGNAKTLYSIDDGNGNPINPTDLFTADTLTGGISAWEPTADGNRARINNGKVEFDLSNELPAGVNSLGAGDQFTDTFIYAIRLGNGTLSWAHVRITIDGANDSATIIASNDEDTAVEEAGGVANGTGGDPDASGQLTVNDLDAGENKFQVPASLEGTYGTFTFDEISGAWTYTLNQSKADKLIGGEAATDKLTVTSFDGTASYDIKIDITGSNDDAKITVVGTPDSEVTEAGGAGNTTPGDPDASGTLAVSDVDAGENKFKTPASLDGTYGTFTFDPDSGAWTYTLDDGKSDKLAGGEAAQDALTVTSFDGTASYDIEIDITGINDDASIAVVGKEDTSVTESGGTANSTLGDPDASGALAVSDVDAGENKFQDPSNLDGTYGTFTLDPDSGAWSYTLDQSKADKLAAGEAASDKLTVTSFDGTATHDILVDITGANDAPVITSDGGGATGSVSIDENTTAVTIVAATDVDLVPAPDTLKFSLAGGADKALFAIDETSGALSFIAAPNFEAPVGGDNSYEVVVQVSDGSLTDTQTLTVTVKDVNDAPVITSDGRGAAASVSIDENTTSVTTVTATDEDTLPTPDTLKYTLVGGADKALFAIDEASGALSFVSAPNFEAPVGGDNSYEVEVQVSDGAGGIDTQLLTVTVKDVNDAPVITSDGGGATASVSIDENTTAVTAVAATDEDTLPAPDTLKFSLVGGADKALFAIDETSGALSFISAPNFEAPVGGDNSYEVQVQVSDGAGGGDTQTLTVTIKDVNDAPGITSNGGGATASVSIDENTKAVTTVTATDEDTLPAPDTLKFSLAGGADKTLFTIDETSGALSFIAAPNFEVPVGGDNSYEVQVQVSDGVGGIDTQTLTVTVKDVNDAPVITSNGGGATASVSIDENTKAVTTVTATDEDTLPTPDTLKFSLAGGTDKALFTIDETSGALSFIAAPDFEAPLGGDNSYEVIVQVSDGVGGIDTQALTVTVKDVAENAPPVIGTLSANTISEIAQKGTFVGKVSASDDEPGHTFSLTDNAGGRFAIDAATGEISLADSSPLDFESFTSHSVEVKVTDSEGAFATKTFAINVTDVASVSSFTGSGGTNDTVDGTSGNDSLNGANGNDILYGGQGSDTLNGGNGVDRLFGQDGDDSLMGDASDDFVLHGGAGIDTLSGGNGGDLLIGGTGADVMNGGAGIDTFRFLKGDLGSGVDSISGFDTVTEKLQIGDLLTGFGGGSILTDFVKATSAGDTTISIDADGAANGVNFVDLVVLQGVASVTLANIIDTSAQGPV